jgi:Leucine-rich repeat (LRR) protein
LFAVWSWELGVGKENGKKQNLLLVMATISSIVSLPSQIFYLLANYLLPLAEQEKRIFRFSSDWRNFINASKEYFAEWKRQCQLIKLDFFDSKHFQRSAEFRQKIFEMIRNPLEQLELRFHLSEEPPERSLYEGVKRVKFFNGQLANFPSVIGEIYFRNCHLAVTPENFPEVRTFSYFADGQSSDEIDTSCIRILEEATFDRVSLLNYQSLSNLQSLSISSTESVSDVSCFRNIPKLKFYACHSITDVSCLGNVRELELFYCSGITDVSALGRVYKLKLIACENVTDVSSLGTVHQLKLDGCTNIKEISALGNVPILGLDYCRKVRDVSGLQTVRDISLVGFEGNDLSGLKSVEQLDLRYTPGVTDITMLKTVKSLHIDYSSGITDFRGLENLRLLHVHFFDYEQDYEDVLESHFRVTSGIEVFVQLTDFHIYGCIFKEKEESSDNSTISLQFQHVPNVRTLKFHHCLFSRFPNVFPHLQSLIFYECKDLSFLSELPSSLGYLEIRSCPKLKKLDLTGGDGKFPVYLVTLYECDDLSEVQISRKISKLHCIECMELKELRVYSQIGYLRVEGCPELKNVNDFSLIVFQDIL